MLLQRQKKRPIGGAFIGKTDAPPISFLFMGPPSDHLVNGMLGLKAPLHSWLFNAKSTRRTTTENCNQK